MNRVFKGVIAAGAVFAVLVTSSACGTVVKTGQDYQAIHYEDGAFSKQTFKDCVGTGARRRDGLGDVDYYYPAGERTFEFDGTDAPPIFVQTKDSQEVSVSGVITFRFTEDCNVLRKFHEDKGLKRKAYFVKTGDDVDKDGQVDYVSTGWQDFLKTYFEIPARAAMNAESLKYGWQELYSSTEKQNLFKGEVVKNLPAAINASVGDKVVEIVGIQTTPPQPDAALKKTVIDAEVSKSAAKAEEAKARAEVAAQQAKNDLLVEKFNGTKKCLAVYTEHSCLALDLQNGPNPPQFIPYGSNINVPGK